MKKQLIPFQGKTISAFTNDLTSKPAIIMMHGNSMSSKIWQKQFENSLSEKYFLIAYDLPGHGESERLPSYSVSLFAETIEAVINHFALTNYVLVGNSLGGDLILQASADLKNCKGLVILNTPPLGKPAAMDKALLPDTLVGMFFTKDYDEANIDLLAKSVFFKTVPAFFKQDFINTDGASRQSLIEAVVALNYKDEVEALKNISIPVAMVSGKEEMIVNNNYFESLTIPSLWKNKIHLIEDAAHNPQWENMEAFDTLIDEFCSTITPVS